MLVCVESEGGLVVSVSEMFEVNEEGGDGRNLLGIVREGREATPLRLSVLLPHIAKETIESTVALKRAFFVMRGFSVGGGNVW